MDAKIYVVCGIISLLGAAFHFFQNLKEERTKAFRTNFGNAQDKVTGKWFFSDKQYFIDERYSIICSLLFIAISLMVFTEAVAKYQQIFDFKKAIFAFVGYGGDSLASKIFGLASKRALALMDNKSTQIDIINNTLDSPTPAVMPNDKPKA